MYFFSFFTFEFPICNNDRAVSKLSSSPKRKWKVEWIGLGLCSSDGIGVPEGTWNSSSLNYAQWADKSPKWERITDFEVKGFCWAEIPQWPSLSVRRCPAIETFFFQILSHSFQPVKMNFRRGKILARYEEYGWLPSTAAFQARAWKSVFILIMYILKVCITQPLDWRRIFKPFSPNQGSVKQP